MPAGDRTGPRGMGPKTGRGQGYCTGSNNLGFGRRQGMGRGRGMGRRGQGRGFRNFPMKIPNDSPKEEIEILKTQKKDLEKNMEEIDKRLEELNKQE